MKKFAKIIRIVTLPPIMAAVFLCLTYFFAEGVFVSPQELAAAVFFIAVLPVLVYPVTFIIPALKKRGRSFQRGTALAVTPFCYLGFIVCLAAAGGSVGLWLIGLTYFLSGLGLVLLNILKLRASGHACAIMGPLALCIYFFGPVALFGAAIPALVFWASLYTGRHTLRELIFGSIVPLVAFLLAYLARFTPLLHIKTAAQKLFCPCAIG